MFDQEPIDTTRIEGVPNLVVTPHMAYYSEEALKTARASGFDYACTTIEGANFPGEDLFELRRIDCGGQTPKLLDLRLAVRGVWSPRAARAGLAATDTAIG